MRNKYDWSVIRPYLEANFNTKTIKQIALDLNFPYQVLRDYSRRIGLNKYKSIDWTKDKIDYLISNYKNGARPIATKFGLPITSINKKANELGLKVIPKDSYINNSQGYKYIGKSNNRKAEHVLVAEQILGRTLKTNEVVHHKNRDKLDNRPCNLEVMTRAEHINLHRTELNNGKSK